MTHNRPRHEPDRTERTSEPNGSNLNRRRLLGALGTGALGAGLAGCVDLLFGGTRTENAPNATYEPTDEHPLIGYDKTVRTGSGSVGGQEVEVKVTVDFFLHDLLDGLFGVGTMLIPQVSMAGFQLTSFGDRRIEVLMNDPSDRQDLFEGLQVESEVAQNQGDPQRIGTRQVPDGQQVFVGDKDVTVETWVTIGDEGGSTVLLDVVKGPLNFDPLAADYDGEVTFATSVYNVYDDVPGQGETPIGNTVPQEDVGNAKDLHDELLEEGLVILDDPEQHIQDQSPTTSPGTTRTTTQPPTTTPPGDVIEFEFSIFRTRW